MAIAFDADSITVTFAAKRSRFGWFPGLGGGSKEPSEERWSLAIAALRATADRVGEPVTVADDRIVLGHRTLSELPGEAADALGLPPLVDLTLRTDVSGQIGSPGFRLTYTWRQSGGKAIAPRTGAILETSGPGADGLRRLPGWMMDALDVADARSRLSDGTLDEDWAALARFRRALEPGVSMDGREPDARVAMTDFLAGLQVTLTDRFSISPKDHDQFDIVPFLGETVDALEREGEAVSEGDAGISGGALQTFRDKAFARGARPAYALGRQEYLVVDPAAFPVLEVMTGIQQADPATRAEFIRNPRQRITEAVETYLRSKGTLDGLTPEQVQEEVERQAEPAFVETSEYSERVLGLTVYRKPAMSPGESGSTWLPEMFPSNDPDAIQAVIDRINAAMAAGESMITVDGTPIPATPGYRDAFQQLLETVRRREPDAGDGERPSGTGTETARIILDTVSNLDVLGWTSRVRPRQPSIPDTVPEVVQSSLKPHQLAGFRWAVEAWCQGLPGILNADEQGLGKTLQAIAFLAWMKAHMQASEQALKGPVLVVAPTTLLVNWEQEVQKHLRSPALGNIVRLYGPAVAGRKQAGQGGGVETEHGNALLDFQDLDEAIAEGRGHRYWILTTYTTLTNYQHSLARIPFSTVVFDEIQALKNPVSLRALAATTVNADFRIGLTGTPIENSTVDLWAIMDQLTPGRFGPLQDFRKRYGEPENDNMRELYGLVFESQGGLPPVALRRLKDDVATELPSKERLLHPRLMPQQQADVYELARSKLATGTRGSALKMLHHIRSVSVHPDATAMQPDEEYIALSARLAGVMDLLEDIQSRNERVLVFIEHLIMQYRFIELVKRRFGLTDVGLINGSTPIKQRQAIVDRFQEHLSHDRGFDVLVLSPKAAGTGLTLTAATHVIHLSRWWNPAVEEQCNDRVHRIGQTRPVTVHVPMAIHPGYQHNSFDCLLHSLMTSKRALASSALWPMGDTGDDAARLQNLLSSEDVSATDPDPLQAAIRNMFQRDGNPLPPQRPTGGIPYR